MKIYILAFFQIAMISAIGQNTFRAIIKNSENKEFLNGATISIRSIGKGVSSNENGYAEINNVPDGIFKVEFSYSGFKSRYENYLFPVRDTVIVLLEMDEEKNLDEVIVQSTRTSRTIKNTPTRIETIDAEEVDEKNNMRPANVSMLLHESTGIQVQQTSATSGSASIRVQGLDGRYTQILKDGYPNFGNFSSGLSVLEIPPLDLKQVEVIKGPSSTLYGGGAIAGVVNFISKTPEEKGEHNFIFNQSNIGQTNVGVYSSKRNKRFGYAILGLLNFQKTYDVDKDHFSDLPKSHSFTINPRLFFYPGKNAVLMLGNSYSRNSIKGGDMFVIAGKADADHVYFEENKTQRNIATLEFDKKFENKNSLRLRQSVSLFDRTINIPNYSFSGINTNSFTDISYLVNKKKQLFIGGINVLYDGFKDRNGSILNAQSFTTGFYIQQTWDISERIKLENGLRFDNVRYSNRNFTTTKAFLLPKISALFRLNNQWTSRIGGGLGYKTPTIFTEQTETFQYRNLLPLENVQPEKSIGATADINFKKSIAPGLQLSINQLFFLTQIKKPLILQQNGSGNYFINATKPVVSKGFETNLKFIYRENMKLFVGYTYTHAKAKYLQGNQYLSLIPGSKLNLALIYEREHNLKLGIEGYFTDKQYLTNGIRTPSFWEFGFMAEKTFKKKFSLFINFENFTDVRQSRYKRIVNSPDNNPSFDEIWTHLEGFVVNGGVKIKL